jgi:uncharacterized protein (TIGR04255 family)
MMRNADSAQVRYSESEAWDVAVNAYDSPPVNEVVLGLIFQPLVSLRVVHFGLIWEKIRADYPVIEHAPPLGFEEAIMSQPVSGWPLFVPRVWFINRTQDKLIQLQHDRFYVNWRSRAEGVPYPRYPAMIQMYEQYLEVISDMLKQENLGDIVATSYEVRYINHIPKGAGWDKFEDIGNIFPDVAWRGGTKKFLPPPVGGTWSAVFNMPNNMGRLNVRAQPGVRDVKDDKKEIILLELTANGPIPGTKVTSAREWFDLGHEWIVRGFADLTSLQMQRTVWKRKDGDV